MLPEKEDFSIFSFEKANWNEIGLYIVQNLFLPYCFSNVDVVVDLWYGWLLKILEKHIPKKTKHRMILPPWVSNETSNAIKRRYTMRKWMIKKPSPNNYLQLATLESRVSELLKEDQKEFEQLVFENGTFSQIQKYFKSIQKSSQLPSEMYLNDQIAVTDKKARPFNEFFQSVFTNSDYQRTSDNSKPSKVDKPHFTREEVQTTLENLCIEKAKGPDGLGNLPLKSLTKYLAPSLTLVFNIIGNKHVYPSLWKLSILIPIFKDGYKQDISNYRLIALLDCLSKVLETLIFEKLYVAIGLNICKEQHGFTKCKSTMTQMILYLSEIFVHFESPTLTALYLDFEKAFNKVSHEKLIKKIAK